MTDTKSIDYYLGVLVGYIMMPVILVLIWYFNKYTVAMLEEEDI